MTPGCQFVLAAGRSVAWCSRRRPHALRRIRAAPRRTGAASGGTRRPPHRPADGSFGSLRHAGGLLRHPSGMVGRRARTRAGAVRAGARPRSCRRAAPSRTPQRRECSARAAPMSPRTGLVVGALALFAPLPDPAVLAGLVVLAVLAGLELRVDARGPIPRWLPRWWWSRSSWVVTPRSRVRCSSPSSPPAPPGFWYKAVGGGPPARGGRRGGGGGRLRRATDRAGALVAALVFELVIVTRIRRIVWTAPLVCSAIALAYGWEAIGAAGALVFGAGMLAIDAAAAAWGAPPWASRVLGPWAGGLRTGAHRAVVLITAVLSVALAIAAVTRPGDRAVLVPPRRRPRRVSPPWRWSACANGGSRRDNRDRRRAAPRVLARGAPRLPANGGTGRRMVGGDPRCGTLRGLGIRPRGPSRGGPTVRPGLPCAADDTEVGVR